MKKLSKVSTRTGGSHTKVGFVRLPDGGDHRDRSGRQSKPLLHHRSKRRCGRGRELPQPGQFDRNTFWRRAAADCAGSGRAIGLDLPRVEAVGP